MTFDGSTCWCVGNALAMAQLPANTNKLYPSGFTSLLMGTCDLYNSTMNSFPCQNVTYTSTGCLGKLSINSRVCFSLIGKIRITETYNFSILSFKVWMVLLVKYRKFSSLLHSLFFLLDEFKSNHFISILLLFSSHSTTNRYTTTGCTDIHATQCLVLNTATSTLW